jgi:uncharacterized protein YndB with AHSA1/START domain
MMASIKHLLNINAPVSKVYEALTTINGLANWWTKQTSGSAGTGGIIQFRFGEMGSDMKVIASEPDKSVTWECVDGFPDWVGTKITFKLTSIDEKTKLQFEHSDWKEDNEFFAGCSFSWARYMESLRQLCQTGKGEAFGTEGYRK